MAMRSVEERLVSLVARYAAIEKRIEDLRQMTTMTTTRHCDPCDPKELQPCTRDTPEVAALRRWCLAHHFTSTIFRWVPSDYYQHSLQWRRDILGAHSIHHLCKSILMENTHCTHPDCSHRENSRYYLIVYPYTEKFDSELLTWRVKQMNEGLGKKKFNFRLADAAVALQLTGFGHGAVAAFGTATDIPVIMSDSIPRLSPPVFWMGGGHVDCKARVDVAEFVDIIKPIVATITTPLTSEELEHLVS